MRTDVAELEALSHVIAAAIAGRDIATLRHLLAPGFVARSFIGESTGADVFLQAIASIPGEIGFVRVGDLQIDVDGDKALVTGVQEAQLTVEGSVVDDRRGFIDYFARVDGAWLLKVAVDVGSLRADGRRP
jgi:hypothetical protein